MSEDWAGIAAEVGEAVLSIGTSAAIIRKGQSGGDSFNPTPGAETEHPCSVVYSKWSSNRIDGTMVRATDQKVLLSTVGLSIVPEIGDRLWDGVSMNGAEKVTGAIVEPLPRISPAGVDVMYTLNVRY